MVVTRRKWDTVKGMQEAYTQRATILLLAKMKVALERRSHRALAVLLHFHPILEKVQIYDLSLERFDPS
jgi:hypothetical protein